MQAFAQLVDLDSFFTEMMLHLISVVLMHQAGNSAHICLQAQACSLKTMYHDMYTGAGLADLILCEGQDQQ